jgi:hypothetical protein
MVSEYPGAIWAPISGKSGQDYRTLQHPKICLHTTETRGLPNYSSPPHLTLDLAGTSSEGFGTIWQHLTLERGAYALRSPGRPHSPNADAGPVIQIELIGYAKDTPDWTDAQYDELGKLLRWLMAEWDIPARLPAAPFVGSEGYGTDAPTRWQSFDEMRDFSGVHAHAHAWYSSHWDVGNIHEGKLMDQLTAEPTPEPDPDPWPGMWPLKLGMESHDVAYARSLLHALGHAIDPQRRLYDEEMRQAVAAEFPNAGTDGKRITGRQGALLVVRLVNRQL